jgi:spermidine synthase
LSLTLFALTLFTSAALLFFVQPLVARLLLPRLGGTPAVWNTCLVFFQALLLAGYLYAHLMTTFLALRWQVVLHAAVLLGPLAVLPIGVADWQAPAQGSPIPTLLALLAVSVGLPFFVVSTTAPLVQAWFARGGTVEGRDPYFLYAASNLGSLGTLMAYPLVIEQALPLQAQGVAWTGLYVVLIVLVIGCGASVWNAASGTPSLTLRVSVPEAVTNTTRLRWVALAAVPASLLLSVTHHLTADIAAMPLLWVIPLALYLGSFVLVFARRQLVPPAAAARTMPLVVIALVLLLVSEATHPVWLVMLVHLATFAVICVVCHGELARTRPPPASLTEFYLWLSVGGVLGGLATALIAPLVFRSLAEYPLALVAACLLRPAPPPKQPQPAKGVATKSGSSLSPARLDVLVPLGLGVATLALVTAADYRGLSGPAGLAVALGGPLVACYLCLFRPVRFGLAIGALLLAAQFRTGVHGQVLHAERSFFGIHRVTRDATGRSVQLVHGSTVHGVQRERQSEPLTYYHRRGPIGQVFELPQLARERPPVAVVGLGAGSLASYVSTGQSIDFYEIDPVVVRIAEDPRFFTYLQDCPGQRRTIVGDARLKLAESASGRYGLVVIDAFSSDAVPLHLMTREALALYLDKLAPGGVIACNVSSRYVELRPVLADLARDRTLVCLSRADLDVSAVDSAAGKSPSIWVILARREEDIAPLADDWQWERLPGRPTAAVWTDDYANVLSALKWE